MNITVWLEFALTYLKVAVQHFDPYAMRNPPGIYEYKMWGDKFSLVSFLLLVYSPFSTFTFGKIFFCSFYISCVNCNKLYNHHHHHHVMPPARISLTLSRHSSLSFITSGRSSGLHPYSHRAAVCMFELAVLLLFGHMRGSIGVHHIWARPGFSNSVLHVWSV